MNSIYKLLNSIRVRYDAKKSEEEKQPSGNTRLPYGIAKAEGIDTKGMSPRQVWKALEGEGYSSELAYKALKDGKRGKEISSAAKKSPVGEMEEIIEEIPTKKKRTRKNRIEEKTAYGGKKEFVSDIGYEKTSDKSHKIGFGNLSHDDVQEILDPFSWSSKHRSMSDENKKKAKNIRNDILDMFDYEQNDDYASQEKADERERNVYKFIQDAPDGTCIETEKRGYMGTLYTTCKKKDGKWSKEEYFKKEDGLSASYRTCGEDSIFEELMFTVRDGSEDGIIITDGDGNRKNKKKRKQN